MYDEVESQLLNMLKSSDNGSKLIDLMSWYCKALSSSGQQRYKSTVTTVYNDTNSRKLKKYAEQSLNAFAINAEKRKNIAQFNQAGIDKDSASIIIDLESKDLAKIIGACKRIIASEQVSPEVFEVVAQELSFGLTQQPVEESYGDSIDYEKQNDRVWSTASTGLSMLFGYEKLYSEAMSMLCRALSLSGDKNYRETLKKVINSTDYMKIKGYAKKAYKKL